MTTVTEKDLKDPTLLTRAAYYFRNEPHQKKALNWLWEQLTDSDKESFILHWRSEPAQPLTTIEELAEPTELVEELQPTMKGVRVDIPGYGAIGTEDAIPGAPHFRWAEFIMNGSERRFPQSAKIAENIIAIAGKLEEVRGIFGDKPIAITSGYRPPHVNSRVGGTSQSKHLQGHAVDIKVIGVSIWTVQQQLESYWTGKRYGGFGRGAKKGFVHLDLRTLIEQQSPAVWNY